ncbi:MAG: ribosomal RNA small subunit methyltransferase A [Candidatus Freyarchaeota archaeon]|nr:ribosomal RNA small subunit methyltransferase A [Candidatus Jordarchaeia archaeon]
MDSWEIRAILKKCGVKPSKRRGQNFLINPQIIRREVDYAEVTGRDVVLEVGAGLGGLTHALAERAKLVYAIESDERLALFLRDHFSTFKNVEVIHADFLKIDPPAFNKLVSNPPYSISAPLIFKIAPLRFEKAVLILQLEFARRLVASPGSREYGRLSVSAQTYLNALILEVISRRNFYPAPKVDSAIVLLTPKPAVVDEPLFSEVSRCLFASPNRKVKYGLHLLFDRLGIPKSLALQLAEKSPLSEKRPRHLTPEEVKELTLWVKGILHEGKKAG